MVSCCVSGSPVIIRLSDKEVYWVGIDNLMIKHSTHILARGIQSILDKYNTAEGHIPCKGDPKKKL